METEPKAAAAAAARWDFGSVVHARITTLGLDAQSFARQHALDRDALADLLAGRPVSADTAVAVLRALDWSPDVLDEIERLPPIPVRDGLHVVAPADAAPARPARAACVLLRAYCEPSTLHMIRVEVDRLDLVPMITPAFIRDELLGRRWIRRYSREYVATMDTAIQAAARGARPAPVYGASATGEHARVVVTAADAGLVELRYELSNVEPITRERWHFASLDRGRAVVRRDLPTNLAPSDE